MERETLKMLYTVRRLKWLYAGIEGVPITEDILHDVCVEILEGAQNDPFEDDLHMFERLLLRRVREGRLKAEEAARIPRTPSPEQLEEREVIQGAMEELTSKQAGAVWRCLAGGETYRALAQEEGTNFAAIQQRVESGVKKLRTRLASLGEGRKQRGERRVRHSREGIPVPSFGQTTDTEALG